MPEDRATSLFWELHSGLPRQGPGSAASTRRALGLVPDLGPETRVLDIGCGPGAQTLVLAENSPSRIVAVDNHPPFIEALNRKAHELGLADRLEARVADMRRLDFADGSFDLIWCEGAIYIMGVEAGLRDWRRLLRRKRVRGADGGVLAEARPPRRMRSVLEPGVPGHPRHLRAPCKRSRRAATRRSGTFRSPRPHGGTTTTGHFRTT